MINSFEVAAVFAIKNEASKVLATLSEEVKAFTKLVKDAKASLDSFGTGITSINRKLGSLNDQAAKTKEAFGSDLFAGLGKSVDGAIGQVDALKAAWVGAAKEITAAAETMATAIGASGVAAGAGGAAGAKAERSAGGVLGTKLHARLPTPIPHAYVYPHGNAGVIAGGAGLLYGTWENMTVMDRISEALVTGQVKLDKDTTESKAFDRMYDIVQKGAAMGGFGQKDVAQAILQTERQFGGLPFEQRLDIISKILPYAEGEARLKQAELPEAYEALVGLSHMSGIFNPEQLPEAMRAFAYASTITPRSIKQFSNTLSYSMPILHSGFDMDPNTLMFLTAMMQTAGIQNTKAGTWIRTFFQRLTYDDSTKVGAARTQELMNLGFLDKDSSHAPSWWVDAKGQHVKESKQVDWMKSMIGLSEKMHQWLQSMPAQDRLNELKFLFGERGGGAASMQNLSQFVEQFPILAQKLKLFEGGGDVLSDLARLSPLQDARIAWADLTNVLMDISRYAVPPLVGGLQTLDGMFKSLHDVLPKPNSGGFWDHVAKGATEGAGVGAVTGLGYGLLAAPFTAGTSILGLGALGGVIGGGLGAIHGGFDYLTGSADKAAKGLDDAGKAASDFASRWGAISSSPGKIDFDPGKLKQEYLQKQSFEGGDTSKLLHPISWQSPPQSGQPIYVTSKLDIDGRTLAESVAQEIAGMLAYPAQAPFVDGRQAWWPPDSQVTTT